ncbi:HlyD family secretion protein [Pseudorhizobium flavum]|uniref:Membrane fusion protein (Multidrug efflux system) n=1 Tax=Pseudorhizobium flavum TaxID=1335061 RepID=A0A7X0DEG7_9HYPH|nr:HlyD family secretion protein [Pseudorhizobium flavum]MBB6181907.1 membrane fusion protein (multidrug efflux system) [Pseudorhizobium flavum]CAD6628839.1 HlyD family secretion protein [Pseudorhizobium flavum]
MDNMKANSPDIGNTPSDRAEDLSPPRRSRVKWLKLLIIGVLVGGTIWLSAPWLRARFTQIHIDDARIAANIVTVSSEVAGRVTALPIVVGDSVNAGDMLATIDRESSEPQLSAVLSKLDATDAQLAEIRTRKMMLEKQLAARREAAAASIAAANANHEAALAAFRNAQSRHDRVTKLAGQNVSSQQNLEDARATLDAAVQQERAAAAAIESARADLAIVEADAAQMDVLDSQVASVLAGRTGTEAERSLKEIDLANRTISAAFPGIVDATFVDVGEYVTPGTRLVMYHAPDEVWIDANVKETSFGSIQMGSKARITVDAFPGREFAGEVTAMGGAATSQLALLPSPNPSGNFTKVTQRLPLRISINPEEVQLRPGMMVEVYIDVAD